MWTLTANGQTRKAYASIKSDYLIDPQVISTEVGGDNGNPPTICARTSRPISKVRGSGRRGR